MDFNFLIISFVGLMILVCGIIIFVLRLTLISSTEGAVNRLNEEIAKANTKQSELAQKLRAADEELNKRRAEAKLLADKMRSDAAEESKAEREKIIQKAREEGEDIIAKAQNAKEKIKKELEKETSVKVVQYSMRMLNEILSQHAKDALHEVLIKEFIDKLKDTDMSRISLDVKSADLITIRPLDESKKSEIQNIIKGKLNRSIELKTSTDQNIGGGVILKFGSIALDGSILNFIREKGIVYQAELEEKYV